MYRNDRLDRKGGGVIVWVKNCIQSYTLNSSICPSSINALWLHLKPNITLCACYIPPSLPSTTRNTINDYFIHNADIFHCHSHSHIIFAGDFNKFNTDVITTNYHLEQIVNFPTRGDNILDLILMDAALAASYSDCVKYPPLANSDHNIIYLPSSNLRTWNKPHKTVELFDYRNSHISDFLTELSKTNWLMMYHLTDINEKCSFLYKTLYACLEKIPKQKVSLTQRDKPWITPLCKHLINQRWAAYRQRNFALYNLYKIKVKKEIEKCKTITFNKLSKNSRGFWKLINDYRKSPSTNSSEVSANDLNNFLCDVFLPKTPSDSTIRTQLLDMTWYSAITVEEVERKLYKLPTKGCGSDGIPSKLLKLSAHILCYPLCHIFNVSLSSGTIPSTWKIAKIMPLPKCSNPQVSDYRPISLLPIVSKLLERCILDRIYNQIIPHYGSSQFGFRKGSSTACALLALQDSTTKHLDNPLSNGVSVICFDASKAFDTVDHHQLMSIIEGLGLADGFVKWIMDYLTDRKQFVEFNNQQSDLRHITSGVPQGAVLSPILFCVFISSLSVLKDNNSIIKYADDIILTINHSKSPDDEANCSLEINNIINWFKNHKIKLNLRKTTRIYVPKNKSHIIEYNCLKDLCTLSKSVKILGVQFNTTLTWSDHINYVVKKCSKNMYLIKILRKHITKKQAKILYNALIQSNIEYCCILYNSNLSYQDKHKLSVIYNRAHFFICQTLDCNCNYIASIHERRALITKTFFNTIINNPNHLLYSHLPNFLQSGRRLNIPFCFTSRRLNSFFIAQSIIYNNSN